MRVRSWKHQWLLLCLVKLLKNCGSGASNKNKTKLACILEADESTRMRMGNSIPQNHEDHIAGKGENSLQHYNLVHKFIPMPQAMKIPAAKAAVDKGWGKLEKISAWNLTKVRSKKQVIDEARTSGAKVHFASLMDICHLKNAELETKHQKYKGRVVLRGDIVKDDSASYAVFTARGSSASQMTAAKVMHIISRLPGCSGQAADAVSASTQVKMEDARTLMKIPKSECPDTWIRLPKHTFLLSEICTVILQEDYYGKCNSRKFFKNTIGQKFQLGIAYSFTEKQNYSCPRMWNILYCFGKSRTLVRHGKFSRKTLIWENQRHSSTMLMWVALKENVR